MKERRALDILGQVDEKYVAEATFVQKEKRRPLLWIGLAACLCLFVAGIWGTHPDHPLGFVLTAYAADEVGYEVSKTPAIIRSDIGSEFFSIYFEGDREGRVSFPFRMACKGENIDSITYSIIGETTAKSLAEMEKSNVWFASEKPSERRMPGDFPEYEVRRTAEGAFATSYMGNSYTVAYNEQDSSEMFLVFRIESDNGEWKTDDINISVSVLLKDGSVSEEQVLIHPVSDGNVGELHISLS